MTPPAVTPPAGMPQASQPGHGWNFADVWEVVAAERPASLAITQGDRRITWRDFERRADALAARLLALGAERQSKVALYLFNCPEYLESVFACFKASLVPFNTNYRYGVQELRYLWDNADAELVVFHAAFAGRIAELRRSLSSVKAWVWVDDGSGERPEWAVPYEAWVSAGSPPGSTVAPSGRSGDDLCIVYTGGTTGLPKGVMWRQDDLFAVLNRAGELRYREDGDLSHVRDTLSAPSRHPVPRLVVCPPLMHGSGAFAAFSVFSSGGRVVLLQGRSFSAVELLDVVEQERITQVMIVGDAFARPIADAIDAEPSRWDLSSLWLIASSGMSFGAQTKARLLHHLPRVLCVDTLGSTEALGLASSRSKSGDGAVTTFKLGANTAVIREDGSPVTPHSAEVGMLAVRGRMPVGYYKDQAKTDATFKMIDGERWSVPGDFATVGADKTIQLLGRGSVCINTGGEKVFPDEVEAVLRRHPAVRDAVVVGLPDSRFHEVVVAVVQPEPGCTIDEEDVMAFVRADLAHYKAPRRVVVVESVGRNDAGKVNYRAARERAEQALAGSTRDGTG